MMKNSEGLKKISIHASGTKADSFKALVKDVLHGEEMLISPGLSIFTSPDGTVFEFYGIGSHYPDYLFSHSEIVNSYQVTDLHSALEKLEKQGATLLGKVVDMSASCYYCHIRLEDGNVIGLFQYNTAVL
ncbi:MAG TPA: hypothetical protein VG101_09550 [Puia sp.]|jgi:predicted enzyme related to lactoylglutathione lyase|nr:hypothetical protein [Puia sp.]